MSDRYVPMNEAKHGDLSATYDWRPMNDSYGWVNDVESFEGIEDPVTTTRKTWRLVGESKVTFHPATELCIQCGGEGEVELDRWTMTMIPCPTCKGDGQHPLAGQVEIHQEGT